MGFKLEPIEIVAISLASLAVLLITSYATYKLLNLCRTSSSASTTPIHDTHEHGVGAYGYTLGSGQDNPYMNYPYSAGSSSANGKRTPTPIPVGGIQPSPSTGHTTLVTPSTGGGSGQKLKKGILHSPWQYSKDKDRDHQQEGKGKGGTDELVVVTYEDGLRKLGIQPLREFPNPQGYPQGGGAGVNQYRNVPPINTNVSFSNSHPTLYTATPTATTMATGTPHRPEMVERESSRRTYHSIAGRGHGAGRRGYTNTMGTMGSNLLPSYYIETNAGDD